MPTTTRTFRVFVSSTFEDLKEERDALQREVFPKLRKTCEEHGARFQAIDLRWGVRDEAALDQRTMEICLTEIERCQRTGIKPNFIVLLGQRYGWRPLAARIEASEFETVRGQLSAADRDLVDVWYRQDQNADPPEYVLLPRSAEFVDSTSWGPIEDRMHSALCEAARAAGLSPESLVKYEASATHQEILKGLGRTPQDRGHVFAFFRTSNETAEDPELRVLKTFLREQLRDNVSDYDPGDFGKLCRDAASRLARVILSEVSGFESRPPLDLEVEAHAAFAKDRVRHFTGRVTELAAIAEYVSGEDRSPLVLHGPSGSGKSAVMAKAAAHAATAHSAPAVIRRFIGATPDSSAGISLLRSLCQEISKGYGGPEDAPVEFEPLVKALRERLALATSGRRLIIFLDALDQLAPHDPAAGLIWLSLELPQHAKVIVSTTEVRGPLAEAATVELPPLPMEDAEQVLAGAFQEAHRTLRPDQRARLLDYFKYCGLPLYLKLAFEEARRWKSFDAAAQCPLRVGMEGIIDTLLDRLADEANHGQLMTERSLGYLAAARYGLAEDEMLDLLSADEDVWQDFVTRARHRPPVKRLPVIVWSRLYLDLEPYLTERLVPGGTVVAFYHRQMAARVSARYLSGDDRRRRHETLALHFLIQPDWLDEKRTLPNGRKAGEVIRQQLEAGLFSFAEVALTDIQFVAAKCAAGLVFDLQQDYRDTIAALPEAREEMAERQGRDARMAKYTHDLIAYARGELRRLEVPELVEPWSEERISAEVQRITNQPARLNRIRAFGAFVSGQSHALILYGGWPGFVVQQAYNSANAGPVAVRAAAALEAERLTGMLLLLPHCRPPHNPLPAMQRVLEHREWVSSTSLTPDGRWAVSGSGDRTLRFWDLESGKCLRVLEGHWHWVNSVSLTPDGRRAVSASSDKTLRVWDLETGQSLRTLEGHGNEVTSVSMTPDGSRAVSGSKDTMLRVWDLESGLCRRMLIGHWGAVTSVCVTPDGLLAVSGSEDKTLRVWDLKSWQCLRTLEGHSDKVQDVSVTLDGRLAMSAGMDSTIRVWDLASGQCLQTLEGRVTSVSVAPDGRRAVAGNWDKTVRVWDLEGGRCIRILEGHSREVIRVSVTPDARRAVSGSGDGTLRVWDLERGQCPRGSEWHNREVNGVSVTPDGRCAVASSDQALRIWDLESGQCLRTLNVHGSAAVKVTPDGRRAVSVTAGVLWVWDLVSGQCLQTIKAPSGSQENVSITPDGGRAVSSSPSGGERTLRVWDLESGRCLKTLEGHSDWVCDVSVTPDGRRAVSASWDQTLRVWDLETGRCIRTLEGHTSTVKSVSVTPDGRRAVSGSWDKTVRVWDLESGECLRKLEGHRSSVESVSVTPGGRAVSVGQDHMLRLWDLESGQCLGLAHGVAHWSVASANRLIAGTPAGGLVVFDLSGLPPRPAQPSATRT